jgi:hypothetical protein
MIKNKAFLQTGWRYILFGCLAISTAACSNVTKGLTGGSGGGSVSGSSTISGQVVVSQDDLLQIQSSSGSASSIKIASVGGKKLKISAIEAKSIDDPTELSSGVAVLYEVKLDGSVENTGVTTSVVNGSYTFSNIADGKKYVVGIVATGKDLNGGDNVLKMNAFVNVPSGTSLATTNVTEKSTLIANYIVEKVVKVGGDSFGKDLSTELANKALTTVNTKLEDGSIKRISPVSALTSESGLYDYQAPSDLQKINIEELDNEDSLKTIAGQAALESRMKKADNLTLDAAKAIIRSVFGGGQTSSASDGKGPQGGDNNTPPEFYIEQFGNAYMAKTTVTIAQFSAALNASIANTELKAWLTTERIQTLLLAQANGSNNLLRKLYRYYAGTLSSVDDLPNSARVVFPKDAQWPDTVTSQQLMTVPQTILLMKAAGLMDPRQLDGIDSGLLEQVMTESQGHGPYFKVMSFLNAIQFVQLSAGQHYILEARVTPVKAYKSSGQNYSMTDALNAEITTYTQGTAPHVKKVILQYPKSSGTGTVEFTQQGGSMSSQSVKGLSSKVVAAVVQSFKSVASSVAYNATKKAKTNSVSENDEVRWNISPYGESPQYLDDFVSGTAVVKIIGDDDTVLASKSVTIFKLNVDPVAMVYPRGMDPEKILQNNGWDPDFTPQELEVDSQTNMARPNLRWEAVNVTVPTGYYIAYAVRVGKSQSRIAWDSPMSADSSTQWDYTNDYYRYKQVWSSWDEGRFIRTTSYQLKQSLTQTVRSMVGNYDTTYEVSVTPVMVEEVSGQVVWQGVDSRTNFKVGQSTPWSITLSGRVTFGSIMRNRFDTDANFNGTWYIGLFKNGAMENGTWVNALFSTGIKSPISSTGGSIVLKTRLGTSAEIKSAGYADYALPTFLKTDNMLTKFTNYVLVVWCDRSGLTDGNLDFSTTDYRSSEFMEQAQSNIFMDSMGVRYSSFTNGTWGMLNDEPSKQVINFTVGSYFK